MKKLIGSISVALTLVLSVFGLAACDLVNFNWGTGSDHEHHFTEYEATDPTCTKNGNIRYFKCDVGPNPCGRYYIDLAAMEPVSEESVMIPALGHEYDFTKIVWSEWNGKEITASVTCTQCDEEEPGHVLHPEITVKFTQTKAPTCTAKGEGYYTASFTYEGETYTNPTTKTAEVDMIPHTYNKVPDDGWKWADDHTSVSATFTCTAADCTHTETVTVSGAAITSKVETIEGVCTDGSQTVYTATAEFNGETYDLTDTVVTRPAINEHKAGAWQYDATQHWHKCSVCGEDMDDKASHQVDSTTHKCECGYVEKSYTFTTLTLAANAENTAAILTISGTYTGYDQQGLTELFCVQNAQGNYFFNFWGNGIGRENAKSVTLTKWENGEFSVALDVTDLPVCELRNICRTDLGDQDWKLSTETIQETTITVGEKVYTLQPSNGHDWNNLGLKVASKTVEKTYAITDASIAAEGEAVYVTVSGTFAGYTKEEFLAALQDDKTGRDELAFCVFYDGTGPSDSKWGRVIPYNSKLIEYDAKEGGTFTVKINVTSLEKNKYKIGKDNADYADIKNLSCTGTATVGDKKYDLAGDTGGLALVVSDKPDESKARDLTGISLTAEGGRVYLVYTGTFKGYSEGEMTTYLTDEEIFYFWGNGGALGQKPASRAATFENGKWTLKLDVTDMPDDTEYALCWKDYTGNDLKPPLAGGSDTVQDAGNRTYTLIAQAWNGTVRLKIRTNVSFTVTKGEIAIEGGKTVVTISGTYSNCTKAQFEAVLKDTDETNVGFRVINGGNIIGGEKNWNKVAGPTSYVVGDDNTFTVKIDVTDLAAGKIDDLTAGNYYVNQQATTDTDIKSLTEKYEKSVTNGTKTYKLTGTPGANIALRVTEAPAKTAEFDIANLILFGGNQARVHIAIKSYTGFTEADLAKENVRLYVGEGEAIEPNEASVSSSRADYYFLVTGSSTGTLKLKIGDVELTNIASGVADVNTAFVNPNFYTLALNGDDLVLTVINNDCFTISSIEMQLAGEGAAANLVLKGTYTTVTQAQAELYLKNVIGFYNKEADTNAHKDVNVTEDAWTVMIRVSEFITIGEETLVYGGGGSDIHFTLSGNTEVTLTSGAQTGLKYALVNPNNGDSVHLIVTNALKSISYTSVTLETTADKVYLVFEGNSKGYDKDTLGAALRNTDTGDASLPSFGFWHDRFDPATLAEVKADDGVNWTVKIDITDFSGNYSVLWQNKSGGDAHGPEGFVEQSEAFNDNTYSLKGSVGNNIHIEVTGKLDITETTPADSTDGFDTESPITFSPKGLATVENSDVDYVGEVDALTDGNNCKLALWYVAGDWGLGSWVTITKRELKDGAFTLSYKNGSYPYSVQLFYSDKQLEKNQTYYLSMKINVSEAYKITVNGKAYELKAGDNEIGVIFVLNKDGEDQNGISAIDIQFPGTNSSTKEIAFVLSDIKWYKQSGSVGPVDPEVPEVEITEVYGHAMNDPDTLTFYVKGTLTEEQANSAVILANDSIQLDREVVKGADHFCFHVKLGKLDGSESGKYTLTLKIGDKTFPLATAAVSGTAKDSDSGKTYTLSFEDNNLVVTVSKEVEKKVTEFYNPVTTETRIDVWVKATGYTAGELKEAVVLTATTESGSQEISPYQCDPNDVAGQFHLFFEVKTLAVGTYTLKVKVGEQTWSLTQVVINSNSTVVDGKTFTFNQDGGELQLKVEAVAPAADGSQGAPFSVSDLAAIFEGDSFNEEGYYTKDGEAQEVYVKGMVKSYDAASKQVTLQQIETRGGVLTVALSASELKIVIGEGTYNGSSTEGMTFVVGDVLTVKGYLQKGEDTLTITGKDGTTPTIEVWESANKDTPALDAEADKAALEKFFAALIEEVKGMEDSTKEFVLPLPTRPGVTFEFKVTAGDAAVTIEGGKLKVTRGAEEVTVKIEATIKVAGAKSDFTVDGSPFTFTVSAIPEPEIKGDLIYTFTTASKQGENSNYASNGDGEVDGVTWNLEGNSQINPWRLGGKSGNCDGADRKLTSKTTFGGTVQSLAITFGTANVTVNSVTLNVFTSDPTAEDAKPSFSQAVKFKASDTTNVAAPADGWKGCYYQLVFNLTSTNSSSNQYVEISKIEFYGILPQHVHQYTYAHDAGEWTHTGTCSVPECDRQTKTEECVPELNHCADCNYTYSASEIVTKLYALKSNQTMPGTYSLKGTVTKIDTAYSSQYSNVTFTITVENKTVQCYREKSSYSSKVKVGDLVTVEGVLKYYGSTSTREFDADCKIVSLEAGAGTLEPSEEGVLYTLSTLEQTGSSNTYAGNCDVKVDGITWNIEGNSQQKPWRFGGKSITDQDRKLTGKTAIKGTVKSVVIEFGSANITVNSVTFNVFTSDPTVAGAQPSSSQEVTFSANGTATVSAPEEGWTDCFYQVVFNVTESGGSNKYVTISTMKFYSMPAPAAAAANTAPVAILPEKKN